MFDAFSIWVMPLAIALGAAIICCELWREPPAKGFDLLRAINGIYFTLYVFCPLVVVNAPVLDVGSWNYIYELKLSGVQLVIAEAIALVGYFFLLVGFYVGGRIKVANQAAELIRARFAGTSGDDASRWLLCGNLLFGIGFVSLVKYTIEIGGLWNLLTWGMLYRSRPMPTDSSWVFLKNVVLVTGPASLFYYAWAQLRGGFWRWAMFAFALLVALLALFHHGGRLQLFLFVFTFPIAAAIMGRGVRIGHAIMVFLVGGVFVFLGKEILFLVYNPAAVSRGVENISENLASAMYRVTLEFAFPYLTLAKVTEYVPFVEGYRWFSDFYYGFVSLLPQRVTGGELPRTVSNVVLEMENAPNPADLLSFGYFSLGIPGCFLLAFAFGVVSWFVERALSRPVNRMHAVLCVSWILFWGFRLMYGDPSLVIIGGFHLAFATFLFLVWRSDAPRLRTH